MKPRQILGLATFAAYAGTVVAANWAIAHYGIVPVGFGLVAPAAVWFAGLAFTLRDLLHDLAGRFAVLGAIAVGAALSFATSEPRVALASAAAFTLSELADLAVYEPLRRRRWLLAVTASNIVGIVVDSALFLGLAFGSLAFLPGQIVGKAWMTVLAVALLAAGRTVYRGRKAAPQ